MSANGSGLAENGAGMGVDEAKYSLVGDKLGERGEAASVESGTMSGQGCFCIVLRRLRLRALVGYFPPPHVIELVGRRSACSLDRVRLDPSAGNRPNALRSNTGSGALKAKSPNMMEQWTMLLSLVVIFEEKEKQTFPTSVRKSRVSVVCCLRTMALKRNRMSGGTTKTVDDHLERGICSSGNPSVNDVCFVTFFSSGRAKDG